VDSPSADTIQPGDNLFAAILIHNLLQPSWYLYTTGIDRSTEYGECFTEQGRGGKMQGIVKLINTGVKRRLF
jgi:hypothetical protein